MVNGMKLEEQSALDQQLCFEFYSTVNAMNGVYRKLLRPYKITYLQYLIMLILLRDGPCSLKELAEQLSLDSPSLTPVVKRLEKDGRLKRRRDPNDERTLIIEVTELGNELLNVIPSIQAQMSSCWGLQAAETSHFRKMIRTVRASLERTVSE